MSRIDEALRRAAEENNVPDASTDAVAPEAVPAMEVATLAREPFPVELSQRRRTAASPGATAEPQRSGESPFEPQAENGSPAERSSVFERIDARLAEKVVVDQDMSPVSREQYRRMAAVLHDAQGHQGLRVIMVVSAVPGEGKTLTAANLALTLSESYQKRVLLIDADLRKPTVHQIFRLNTTMGLADGLRSAPNVKLVLRQVSEQLTVLPAGRPTSDPMAVLTSDRMHRVVAEARETFDWVIIDTPPLMLLPDAHLLAALIDGAVLVVRANSTPHDLVKRAAEIVGRDRITGIVLNQATAAAPGYGSYYYNDYYLPDTQEQGQR
jgi:capsular exopolysaccharide synthesis family protein